MRRGTVVAVVGLVGTLLCGHAQAANYNDVTSDLSNAFGSPTALPLAVGSNVLTGRTGLQSSVVDRDYFRITVPPGHHLAAITLLSTDTPSQTFLGLESGVAFTDFATTTQAMMLGWMHFRTTHVGQNLEPLLAAGSGAQGFAAPLGTSRSLRSRTGR